MADRKYVPALGSRWLTPVYDAFVEGPMSAMRMRRGMLAQLGDLTGSSLLDVGSGTGSFAIMVKRAFPTASVTGLDGDPQILELARAKAAALKLDIRFSEAMSYSMPYGDGAFDFVTTSLMLHHLTTQSKRDTLAQMFRVLKPGGRLLGLDFGEARSPVGRALRPLTRRFERVAENVDGKLPAMIAEAGFREYAELGRYVLGSIALFSASKPA